MLCKYDNNIELKDWVVKYNSTQVEFQTRKELKDEICDEFCTRTEKMVCKILTSIQHV
jgi:hypothetical protein